ncbi:Arginase [Penicillium rolfsii]|nr:Arginase [Penicillium rolfsii]
MESTMTQPSTIPSRFLSHPNQLGVVAVGFNGGQDPDHRNMKKPRAVSAVTERLSSQVYNYAKEGKFVLTLGGDHSIAIGTVSGTAKAIRERLGREMAVIWVDAHADINVPEMSPSGNIHGMPMAFLTRLAREDRPDIFGWLKDEHIISTRKLVYIGLRDVDRGEKKLLREHGIKAFSMHDIDRHGIGRVVEMALAHIGNDTPIHLSFDVDALDPQWAPSTGTPVRGGLTLREGDFICECVHETGNLVAMDLVEVNPSLETVGAAETIRAGCSLVRSALGSSPFRESCASTGAQCAVSPHPGLHPPRQPTSSEQFTACLDIEATSVTLPTVGSLLFAFRPLPIEAPTIDSVSGTGASRVTTVTPSPPLKSITTITTTMKAVRVRRETRRLHHWPEIQLNVWLIVVLSASATCLGIFSWFMIVQSQMDLGIPWLFPYMVVVSALGVTFFFLIQVLIAQGKLLPGILIVGSFILFVLWLTGLIETALQLYGVSGNVNDNCQIWVVENESRGNSINTLAWLTQNTICNCWKTAFAFELVNTIFYLWMMIMSWQVHRDFYH